MIDTPLKILVLDDDIDLAESLADILEMRGHDVTLVHNGADAVQTFRENHYDIGFFDVQMPGMNGVESFLEIKKIKPEAKVFMMTGFSVEQLLQQALANGALGVLRKPFDIGELLDKLDLANDGLIVVADDDPDFVDSIVPILEDRGYKTATARTGKQAIELVSAGGVSLLILDLKLPILSGLEVYMELERRGMSIPTIIVTGYAAEASDDVDALQKFPVCGFLHKPFDPRELLAEVDSAVIG